MGPHPLNGKRILVTRPRHQMEEFEQLIENAGGIPVALPSTEIAFASFSEIQAQLSALPQTYDSWIFTSANGVASFLQFWKEQAGAFNEKLPKIAAVGQKTAKVLEEDGFAVNFLPSKADGETLGHELPLDGGEKCLLPRGNKASDELPEILESRGATVNSVVVYETIPCEIPSSEIREKLQERLDAITLTSPSSAKILAQRMQQAGIQLHKVPCVCIGEKTAEAAGNLGLSPIVTAGEKSLNGLVEAMKRQFSNTS